jgi:hypothetical protein
MQNPYEEPLTKVTSPYMGNPHKEPLITPHIGNPYKEPLTEANFSPHMGNPYKEPLITPHIGNPYEEPLTKVRRPYLPRYTVTFCSKCARCSMSVTASGFFF